MDEKQRDIVIEWLRDRGARVFLVNNSKWNIVVETEMREVAEIDKRGNRLQGRHKFAMNLTADFDRVIGILRDQGYIHDPDMPETAENDANNIRGHKGIAVETQLTALEDYVDDEPTVALDDDEVTAKNSNKRVGIKTRA